MRRRAIAALLVGFALCRRLDAACTLEAPMHGSLGQCGATIPSGSRCAFACDRGYVLLGETSCVGEAATPGFCISVAEHAKPVGAQFALEFSFGVMVGRALEPDMFDKFHDPFCRTVAAVAGVPTGAIANIAFEVVGEGAGTVTYAISFCVSFPSEAEAAAGRERLVAATTRPHAAAAAADDPIISSGGAEVPFFTALAADAAAANGREWVLPMELLASHGGQPFLPARNQTALAPVHAEEIAAAVGAAQLPAGACELAAHWGWFYSADCGATRLTVYVSRLTAAIDWRAKYLDMEDQADAQKTTTLVVAAAVSGAVALAAAAALYLYWRCRRERQIGSKLAMMNHRKDRQLKQHRADIKLLSRAWRIEFSELELDYSLGHGRLGEGAFGVVWRATLHGNIPAAVKIMHARRRRSSSAAVQQRQQGGGATRVFNDREARFLMRTRNPYLVLFLGCGRCADGRLFIVQELCEGGSLDRRLWGTAPPASGGGNGSSGSGSGSGATTAGGAAVPPAGGSASPRGQPSAARTDREGAALSATQRIHLLIDICEALCFLHLRHSTLHRDVKSPNVMLMQRPAAHYRHSAHSCEMAKLADFGISTFVSTGKRRRQSTPASTRVSRRAEWTKAFPTTFVGTIEWMAPELVRGEREYGPAVDIFSLSMVMLEMMTGRRPWAGSGHTKDDICQRVAAGERPGVPPPCANAVGPALVPLMKRCWAEEPAERPVASAIVRELYALVDPDQDAGVETTALLRARYNSNGQQGGGRGGAALVSVATNATDPFSSTSCGASGGGHATDPFASTSSDGGSSERTDREHASGAAVAGRVSISVGPPRRAGSPALPPVGGGGAGGTEGRAQARGGGSGGGTGQGRSSEGGGRGSSEGQAATPAGLLSSEGGRGPGSSEGQAATPAGLSPLDVSSCSSDESPPAFESWPPLYEAATRELFPCSFGPSASAPCMA